MGSLTGGHGEYKYSMKLFLGNDLKQCQRPADIDALLTTETDLAYQKAISSRNGPYIMCKSGELLFNMTR